MSHLTVSTRNDAAGIAAVGHDDVDKGGVGDEHIHYKHADAGKNTGELILYGFLVFNKGGNTGPEHGAEGAVDREENDHGKDCAEDAGSGAEDLICDKEVGDGCLR